MFTESDDDDDDDDDDGGSRWGSATATAPGRITIKFFPLIDIVQIYVRRRHIGARRSFE
jgi:hypothetical protein